MTCSEAAGDGWFPFEWRKQWNTSKVERCVSTVCVCVWSCTTPGLGPRQMSVYTAARVQPTPRPAGLGEAVSRTKKTVTIPLYKAGHVYMWFRITDPFQLVSAETKRSWFAFRFWDTEIIWDPFFSGKLEFIDYITSLWAPFSFFFYPLIIILLRRAGLFVMKSKWRRFWLLALSWSCPTPSLSPLGERAWDKGKGEDGQRWTDQ